MFTLCTDFFLLNGRSKGINVDHRDLEDPTGTVPAMIFLYTSRNSALCLFPMSTRESISTNETLGDLLSRASLYKWVA